MRSRNWRSSRTPRTPPRQAGFFHARAGRIGGMKLPFRFAIRDLLWLTTVIALGIGWWIDHRGRMIAERNAKKWEDLYAETNMELIDKSLENSNLKWELWTGEKPKTYGRKGMSKP